MFKKFIPFAIADSVYEIEPEYLKSLGITTVFIDIDNTLDSYKAKEPSEKCTELIERLKHSFRVILVSNNRKKKVALYCADLAVDYAYKAYKPFPKKIKSFIKKYSLANSEVVLIGYQLMTDVWCANNAKIKVIWTKKIVVEDQFTTRINRIFEKIIGNYHKKHGNLKDWRENYGKM